MAIIETFNLSRTFGNKIAVADLNLKVEAGEIMGFLGPNGAGKTTTIRMLAGMLAPSAGYALVADIRTDRQAERLHLVTGLLTESPGFYQRMTAHRNLEYIAGFYPEIDITGNVAKYLKLVGLWERRDDRVGTYSKGMKQRLALARALLHEPSVLFLDEPTAGLDPEAAAGVRELILRLSGEGRTVILCTHNLAEAESLCHRIAVIRTRLLVLDTVEQLRRRFFRRQVVVQLEKVTAPVIEAVKKLPFVQELAVKGDEMILTLADVLQNRPELVSAVVQAGGRLLAVSEKQYPLEDVYLKLVRGEEQNGL